MVDSFSSFFKEFFYRRLFMKRFKQLNPCLSNFQKSDFNPILPTILHLETSVAAILETYADALALNPFLNVVPATLQRGWIVRSELVDPTGNALPLHQKLPPQWVDAIMGGNWLPMIGEWDGAIFKLATLVSSDSWMPLEE